MYKNPEIQGTWSNEKGYAISVIPSAFRYSMKCPILSTNLPILLGLDILNDVTIANSMDIDKSEKFLIPVASKQLQNFLTEYEINSLELVFK